MSEDNPSIPKQIHRFMGVDRKHIDWFPIIDYTKCNHCKDCVEFCAHGVYTINDEKVEVKNPKDCVVFCQACIKMCPKDALIFQDKKSVLKQIKQIKASKK